MAKITICNMLAFFQDLTRLLFFSKLYDYLLAKAYMTLCSAHLSTEQAVSIKLSKSFNKKNFYIYIDILTAETHSRTFGNESVLFVFFFVCNVDRPF